MARKSKLTTKNVRTFLTALEAAREPHKAFAEKVIVSEAKAITGQVTNVTKAGERDWRASMAYLANKAPNEFGPNARKGSVEDERIKTELDNILAIVVEVAGAELATKILDEIGSRAGKPESGEPPRSEPSDAGPSLH